MSIDGGLRDQLEPGTKLVAKYRGQDWSAEVVAGEDGKVGFRLGDGREFKSPSAAGSAVMGGVACNGWRFWSLETEAPVAAAEPSKTRKPKREAPAGNAAPELLTEETPPDQ